MHPDELAVGKVYYNQKENKFSYIHEIKRAGDGQWQVWFSFLGQKYDEYDNSRLLGKGNFINRHPRLATEEECINLQPLIHKFQKEFEDSKKTDKQKVLESCTDDELQLELERRAHHALAGKQNV